MHKTALMKAYRAGVKIAMGSDPIFPHEECNREFASMVKAALRHGTPSEREPLRRPNSLASKMKSVHLPQANRPILSPYRVTRSPTLRNSKRLDS